MKVSPSVLIKVPVERLPPAALKLSLRREGPQSGAQLTQQAPFLSLLSDKWLTCLPTRLNRFH